MDPGIDQKMVADRTVGLISHLLQVEGWPQFVDHPHDRGGPTKGGITLETLQRWRGAATVEDLKALSKEEAVAIYASMYVTEPGFDRIEDDILQAHMVDFGVHSGPKRATRMLQRACNEGGAEPALTDDGIIGPKTLAAVAAQAASVLHLRLIRKRCLYLASLIETDHDQATWANGWFRRVLDFQADEIRRLAK